jgi:hypothetical protein
MSSDSGRVFGELMFSAEGVFVLRFGSMGGFCGISRQHRGLSLSIFGFWLRPG